MEIFNLPIIIGSFEQIFLQIKNRISQRQKTFVVTANATIVVRSIENPQYRKIVQNADLILPDGFGVVLAIKRFHKKTSERITGIDMMLKLCEVAAEENLKVFLLGSKPEVVEKAAKNLEKTYGNIIVGYHHGYFDDDGPIELIKSSKADLLFVGMGVPKQEVWISENFEKVPAIFAMGVGGSFDVVSGYKKRAPKLVQDLRLEWLYRFLQSPFQKKNVPRDVIKLLRYILKPPREFSVKT
ncbi:WecB/TagA/CpsF family glycosyltransferase [Pseudothermotoga sp.]|uniref:WecB/TagA/CpsF family glycosyltransferase n=1 Tax=Pseudothermotoga sp. TaxID=2033661 RepID=UPI0031F668CD